MRGAVLGASLAAHQSLARLPAEIDEGLWLMDEPEAAGIADPLAKLAARHAGGNAVNPDLSDLIAAGMAAAAYVTKNLVKAIKIRRHLRRAGAFAQQEPTEEQAA